MPSSVRRLSSAGPEPVIAGGAWYGCGPGDPSGQGISFRLQPAVIGIRHLWFDILLSGSRFVTFFARIRMRGVDQKVVFAPLCECQTRIVLPLPEPGHGPVTVVIGILRKTTPAARFCLGPLHFSAGEPPFLSNPSLPRGPLVDAMGQSTLHRWPEKTSDLSAMIRRLRADWKRATRVRQPAGRSRWGGWTARRVKTTGFFRTHHDGHRWWLVDPDGYLFWSSGLDCVHPSIDNESKVSTRYQDLSAAHAELPNVLGPMGRCFRANPWHSPSDREFNYGEANCVRAFGAEAWYDRWITLAHGNLRRLGFNTAGDWSDECAARRERTPYVRPLERWFWSSRRTPVVAPDFPDVFHPSLARDAGRFAECLRETRDDPSLMGYFLHNEPPWDHDSDGVAATMLREKPACASRKAFVEFLRRKYSDDRGLRRAWGMQVRLKHMEEGCWKDTLSPAASADVRSFSTVMLDRLLKVYGSACRRIDTHHLNLGIRWWTFPPLWALRAMRHCDVVSFNYYFPRLNMVGYGRQRETGVEEVVAALRRPFLVGEWHFGALDGGLPSAGLCRVADQEERGRAFRVYAEHAASLPWCVGAHWFNMYDRNALSSTTSNENYNIGFFDVSHHPHTAICRAATETNRRIYRVAAGRLAPYDRPVRHLFPSR